MALADPVLGPTVMLGPNESGVIVVLADPPVAAALTSRAAELLDCLKRTVATSKLAYELRYPSTQTICFIGADEGTRVVASFARSAYVDLWGKPSGGSEE